jgi:hypothetical protein
MELTLLVVVLDAGLLYGLAASGIKELIVICKISFDCTKD